MGDSPFVADSEDVSVKRVQQSAPATSPNLLQAEPDREQLLQRDHAKLLAGNACHRQIATWSQKVPATVTFWLGVGHEADSDTHSVTRGSRNATSQSRLWAVARNTSQARRTSDSVVLIWPTASRST